MGRIMAIDYGKKRTGLAVTDPLQIIATALATVETPGLLAYLKQYFLKEQVDELVIGLPRQLDNTDSETAPYVRQMVARINEAFPQLPVKYVDERFTSKIALRAMVEGGMKKKDRRKKENVDKVSATLILQSYLESRR
ncbi:MAG TPA: Holliday junction resolvase RuvX [Cyclobacteriaceae bacterium]|nr:Holliday junction resolvase RuvX [Cyclobacteriaceae bacterium]MCB9238087.1 Holliday junction resolvase RuvX [Flammeovirgaceae bacterium]MCB0499507.1 Holliday junction resolvase RuvX [Cyclobacteriaceae bacterium]MCO5272521.1 Holliday junction resolvase RuvX [Cyclobacteriaceae bacterium]MCW5901589.1 Holliday junction resolvase RuvX [Cyclobacteriaceae bacterium]